MLHLHGRPNASSGRADAPRAPGGTGLALTAPSQTQEREGMAKNGAAARYLRRAFWIVGGGLVGVVLVGLVFKGLTADL